MKNKKAFTIVELVIVIAVIAVLAAVLIPTFVSLIKKANISADTQIVRTLNTALAADTDNEHNTPTDVLAIAAEEGYNVTKLNAKARDNEILWDSANDVFCYLNDGKIEYTPDSVKDSKKLEAGDYRLWKFANKASDLTDNTYSIYAATQEVADAINGTEVNYGVDTGEFVVPSFTYVSGDEAQAATIRTCGGTLIVNASTDKVYHYGNANIVDIRNVAPTSYYENGIVSMAKIKTGRLVITEEALLTSLHVVATDGNYNNIKVGVVGQATLPSFTRDEVTLNDGDKKVVIEVQSLVSKTAEDKSPEYVWISKTGELVSASVATSATVLNESTTVAEASQSAVAKSTATEVTVSITAEELEAMAVVATRYAGGQGTEANPYLLATKAHFGSLDEDTNAHQTANKYFKLITDINLGKIYPIGSMGLSAGSSGTSSMGYSITYAIAFEGTLDGNNRTISYSMASDEGLASGSNALALFGATKNATIKDMTINANVNSDRSGVWAGGLAGFGWQSDIENITINGSITGAHDVGGFFGYFGTWDAVPQTNTIKDCTNNATVICNSKRTGDNYAIAGGFIGQLSLENANYTLTVTNCKSNGAITISQTTCANSAASYFVGFASDNAANEGYIVAFHFNGCTVGENVTLTSSLGDKRTKNNHTVYCAASAEAIAACPAIKYVGITSRAWSVNPAQPGLDKIYINSTLQDMSQYFAQ